MPKNRRHDDSDADDDSSVILVQSPRPAKRRRRTGPVPAPRHAPQRSLLEVLKSGVFAYLDPTDLLALSYTCKRVRRFLTTDESARIWQRARKRLAGPTPPPCPASMSELAWTSLLFTMKCQQCWHATTRDVEFALRMRYCSNCQSKHVKSSQKLKKYPNVSEDVFRLVPYSWTAGKGTKTQYWWEPEVERVYREIKALDARVDSGDREAVKERKTFVTKRIRYVEEVLNNVKRCVQWQTEFKAAQETAAAERSAELRRRIVDKFHERGYRRADVEALLVDEDIRESSCSGRSWTSLFERISTELDRQYSGANAGPLRSKVEALHEHYRKYLKKYVPQEWEALIPFGDVVNMRPVLKRLRTTRHEDLAALATELPTLIDKWRNRVEKKLVALLPEPARAGDEDEEASDAATRLNLATSVFVRDRDPAPHTYPHTLLVPHLLNLEYGPLKYSTPNGPWSLDDMKHDVSGVNVVREFCRYARLDVKTATAQQLDESSLRLHCKLCRDEWPLVLSWRQAIAHLHAKHEGQRGSWGECSDSIRRQVTKLEANLEVWTCCYCPAGKRKKRALDDVLRHVRERHDERSPAKGVDYDRALNVALADPMTVVEVHAEPLGDGRHRCRYCPREVNLLRMLKHLKEKHSITLTAVARTQPPAPEERRPVASGSTQGPKRVIYVEFDQSEEDEIPRRKEHVISIPDTSETESTGAPIERFRSRSQSEWVYEPLPPVDHPATPPPPPLRPVSPSEPSDDDEIGDDVLARLAHVSVSPSRPRAPVANLVALVPTNVERASAPVQDADPRVHVAPAEQRRASPALPDRKVKLSANQTYLCKLCTRKVDRLRRFTSTNIHVHMGMRHHIINARLGVDFEVASTPEPALMPWARGKVYICRRCPPSARARAFNWDKLDFHLMSMHQIVDPVALDDWVRTDCRITGSSHTGPQQQVRDVPDPALQDAMDIDSNDDAPTDNPGDESTDSDVSIPPANILKSSVGQKTACRQIHTQLECSPPHAFWRGFACRRCRVDHVFTLSGILHHLINRHNIERQFIRFGKQYRVTRGKKWILQSNLASEEALAYRCPQCSSMASFTWDDICHHARTQHGQRDPHATCFVETNPDVSPTDPRYDHDPSDESEGDDTQLQVPDVQMDDWRSSGQAMVAKELGAAPTFTGWKGFVCTQPGCSRHAPMSLWLIRLHFRDEHDNQLPRFGETFDVMRRWVHRVSKAILSRPRPTPYFCNHCDLLSLLYSEQGLHMHMYTKHGVAKAIINKDYIDIRSDVS